MVCSVPTGHQRQEVTSQVGTLGAPLGTCGKEPRLHHNMWVWAFGKEDPRLVNLGTYKVKACGTHMCMHDLCRASL